MSSPITMFKKVARSLFLRRIAKLEGRLVADVKQLLGGETIALLDVGSAGGIEPRWRPHRKQIKYVGVEPDSRSSVALMQSAEARCFADYRIVPQAVWNTNGVISFNLCRKPTVSSHFLPRQGFVSRYPLSERYDVLESASVACGKIDDVLSTHGLRFDFTKLDVQGGELAVLEGAEKSLDQCLGLEIEVEFLRIYEDQPLFGDICAYLETKGIEFIDFTSFNRWERFQYRGFGQCIFGDALFLRTPENVALGLENGLFGIDQVKRYLAVLRIYSQVDLMERTLALLVKQHGFEPDYVTQTRATMLRLKSHLHRSMFGLRVARAIARMWNPNAGLHLIY